jgi:hypothetical protein
MPDVHIIRVTCPSSHLQLWSYTPFTPRRFGSVSWLTIFDLFGNSQSTSHAVSNRNKLLITPIIVLCLVELGASSSSLQSRNLHLPALELRSRHLPRLRKASYMPLYRRASVDNMRSSAHPPLSNGKRSSRQTDPPAWHIAQSRPFWMAVSRPR